MTWITGNLQRQSCLFCLISLCQEIVYGKASRIEPRAEPEGHSGLKKKKAKGNVITFNGEHTEKMLQVENVIKVNLSFKVSV